MLQCKKKKTLISINIRVTLNTFGLLGGKAGEWIITSLQATETAEFCITCIVWN